MTLLSLTGLSKSFGSAPALSQVSLDLEPGEVHALMGENGAGKSTLIRILAGVTSADQIQARLDGAPLTLGSATRAQRAGFRFVHQELNTIPALSVAENILLARSFPRRFGVAVNWRRLAGQALQALARLGVTHIDPRLKAGQLGTGDRMLIALAAMLVHDDSPARLFVLDEPTAGLTHKESELLFAVIRELTRAGAAVLYVSHRLDEVMALADRVTVLRDGQVALAARMDKTDRTSIIRAMTGHEVTEAHSPRLAPVGQHSVCRVEISRAGRLRDLHFQLREGEVLGIAGIEDSGQSELLHLFVGQHWRITGSAEVLGKRLPHSPAEAWERGIAFVPRERRQEGLMLRRSITANIVLPHLSRLSLRGLARASRETAQARALAERLRLRFRDLSQPVRTLSGGNQQKVVLARATLNRPRLLILNEPTRGVDVGARVDIYAEIRSLAAQGTSVILASTDLPELIGLSDRILILQDGRQANLVDAHAHSPASLLSLVYQNELATGAA